MKTLPLLSLALLFASLHTAAQVKFEGPGALPPAVNSLYRYFKEAPTNCSLSEDLIKSTPLYGQALDRYFDTAAMGSKFRQRDISPVLQYQVLYSIDCGVDHFPPDSIVAMPVAYYYDRYGEANPYDTLDIDRRYFVTFHIAGKFYPVLDVCMNGNDRFAYLLPMIYFDREKGKVLEGFFRRYAKR